MRPTPRPVSRRSFLDAAARLLGAAAAADAATACALPAAEGAGKGAADGRLRARPGGARAGSVSPGRTSLDLGPGREALLHVPRGYRDDAPAPFAVVLHGASGTAQGMLGRFEALADELGIVLLSPKSRDYTWDVIRGGYGADVELVDDALARAFARCNVDPARVSVAGFSDGASYALSLGLANGDLFRRVVALSPGMVLGRLRTGKPSVFVTHGVHDTILPIDVTSRRIVSMLRGAGYDVDYREFDGPHAVPPPVARLAAERMAGAGAAR